jgi:hypothetical protein
MGTDVNSCLDLLSRGKLDLDLDVVGSLQTVVTVDQSLVEIKHYCLFICFIR